ncbi:uncharacterized protein [Primulina huaijiensis]|uniref:uncharacterized protein isoform X2 n=1 Tax=Primulina huaijiensis TaxID=1492673 RepID=UPI003CC73E10
MKVVDFETPGDPDVLQIRELPNLALLDYHIIIQVAAAGLNVHDTWIRQGTLVYRFRSSSCLGYECSGKVVAVGSGVTEFKVCAFLGNDGGAYAEFVRVSLSHVLRIPSRVSLVEAAALPKASQLTYFALSVLTNVTLGDTVLIHETAAAIDVIAIQYVKHIGCEVFAVAGTEEKLRYCKMLGADVCINYRKEDFCKCAKAETGGKGVNIILDVSGRDNFQKNMDCLARGGSLVISGFKTGSLLELDLSSLMKKDISVIGADIRNLNDIRMSQLWSDVAEKIWPLIENGRIKPIIGKIFTFAEAAEAHKAFEECSIFGKLLLVPE